MQSKSTRCLFFSVAYSSCWSNSCAESLQEEDARRDACRWVETSVSCERNSTNIRTETTTSTATATTATATTSEEISGKLISPKKRREPLRRRQPWRPIAPPLAEPCAPLPALDSTCSPPSTALAPNPSQLKQSGYITMLGKCTNHKTAQ